MAGSGKTAMLAHRGAIRTAFPEQPKRLLYCYNAGVLKRLYDDLNDTLNFKMEKVEGVFQHARKRKNFLVAPGYEGSKSPNEWVVNKLRYHEILVDEAQDLTRLEYDVLCLLTVDGDPRRINLAGDPLQTLNPSGFDWSQTKVMIREKLGIEPR